MAKDHTGTLRTLFLAHFAVPLFWWGDAMRWVWHKRHIGLGDVLISACVGVWVILGLGAFAMSRNRPGFLRKIQNGLLSFYVVLGSLAMVEIGLRVFLTPAGMFMRTPERRFLSATNEQITPGVPAGRKVFSTNKLGLRGPEPPPDGANVYKILAIGGSTTECLFLDDSEEWPHRLMADLNAEQHQRVWVANAGASGTTTVHHLRFLQNVPALSRADLLIFLIGINDLQDSLAFNGASTQAELESSAADSIDDMRGSRSYGPVFRRLRIYRAIQYPLVGLLKNDRRLNSDVEGWYKPLRTRRGNSRLLPLPDLRIALAEYKNRVVALNQECSQRQLRCLFMTQPTMWKDNLSEEEQKLLWFGWVGPMDKPAGYIGFHDLIRAMSLYNQTLLDTCSQNNMECYDLASAMPKDTSVLFDDCHFNVGGTRMVAHLLSHYLVSHGSLSLTAKR